MMKYGASARPVCVVRYQIQFVIASAARRSMLDDAKSWIAALRSQ